MHLVRAAAIGFGLTLLALGHAAEFELTLKASSGDIAQAKALLLFDAGLRESDRIVRIKFGESDSLAQVKVVPSAKAPEGFLVAPAGSIESFGGKIVNVPGKASGKVITGWLAKVAPAVPAEEPGIVSVGQVKDFFSSLPWAWILGGAGALIAFLFLSKGRSSSTPAFVPASKRRSFEETAREIRDRLEKIDQNQRNLVKKPPLLRSFKGQIDDFEDRLQRLETHTQTSIASLNKISAALAGLEASIRDLNSKSEEQARGVSWLKDAHHASDKAMGELAVKAASAEQASRESIARTGEVLMSLTKHENDVLGRFGSLTEGQRSIEGSFNRVGEQLERVSERASALEGRTAATEATLSELAARIGSLDIRLADEKASPDQMKALDELRSEVQSLQTSHSASQDRLKGIFELVARLGYESEQNAIAFRGQLAEVMAEIHNRPWTVEAPAAPGETTELEMAAEPLAPEPEVVPSVVRVEDDPEEEEATPPEVPAEDPTVAEEVVAAAEEAPPVPEEEAPAEADEEAEPESAELQEAAAVLEEVLEEPVQEASVEEEPEDVGVSAEEQEVVAAAMPADQDEGIAIEEEASPVEEAAEADADDEDLVGGDSAGKWQAYGGSDQRQWSAQVARAPKLSDSDEPLKPMTPTETPTIGFAVGAMLHVGSRIVYAHGDTLRGFWPGKDSKAVTLDMPIGSEPWRLAYLNGQVFCVQAGQVEIINLLSWNSQGKFHGEYLDHVCTENAWVGLVAQGSALALDVRDASGRQQGKPRKLKSKADDARSMVVCDGKVVVGTRDGKLYRQVDEEIESLKTPWKADFELTSLSVYRKSLIVLGRSEESAVIYMLDPENSQAKELALDCRHVHDHPVVIGEKLYVVDSEGMRLLTCSLKKLHVTGSVPINAAKVRNLMGLYSGKSHALLLTLLEQEGHSGRLALVDPKDGSESLICTINQPLVDLIAADGKVVLATSCSYQNMIRVFDPAAQEQSLAA